MLTRAFAAGVPCRWVTGDSVYGADYALRRCIEQSGRGYVLAVTSRQRLGFKTVADWLEDVPTSGWQRLSAGEGAKGPRLYDWAWLPQGSDAAGGWQKGLLIRRKLAHPEKFTFYLTLAPEAAGLADLVRVAGTRWTIEASFEAAKGEVGLDQYEVRSWTGWHRHVTLAMLAHAYLAVVRQHAIRGRGPRPRGRLAAPYGSRGAPAHLASRLGQAARPHPRARLVGLATTTPAARQTITLDPQNQNSSTPAVVLRSASSCSAAAAGTPTRLRLFSAKQRRRKPRPGWLRPFWPRAPMMSTPARGVTSSTRSTGCTAASDSRSSTFRLCLMNCSSGPKRSLRSRASHGCKGSSGDGSPTRQRGDQPGWLITRSPSRSGRCSRSGFRVRLETNKAYPKSLAARALMGLAAWAPAGVRCPQTHVAHWRMWW